MEKTACISTSNFTEQIDQLEQEIREKQQQLLNLRKQMPKEEVKDYTFQDKEGNSVKLSELFGNSDQLMVVHNMGRSCPYCTLWADEINGVFHHLNNKLPFVVVSPNPVDQMKDFANSRNWNFRILSSNGNTFKRDVGFETEEGFVLPGVSVFTKADDGKIYHYSKAQFGPGDAYCSVWHYFDLLPEGADKWEPKYKY